MGAGRSPAAKSGAMQVTAQNGKTVYLSSPLVYGKRDKLPIPSGNLDAWEKANKNANRNEQVLVLANDGSAIFTTSGGKNSAGIPASVMYKATVLTHTHPRGSMTRQIGGTFSTKDMETFNKIRNLKTIRAVAAEGTYSMTKSANFNPHKFRLMVRDINNSYKVMQAKCAAFGVDLMTGKIDQHTYYKSTEKVFNAWLVDSHNALLKNRRKCGYSYSLERS